MKKLFFIATVMLLASGPIGSLKAQDSVFSYTHQGTTLYYIVN